MSEEILHVRGIVSRFGRNTVHEGVSFEVEKGEIMGIVGGSGSGKTVLLRTLIGLRKPDGGEVTIAGKRVDRLKPHESARLFGVLFQQGALFSGLTVQQNVELPLKEYVPLPDGERIALARLKVALAGLPPDTCEKYPSELSGGMIKRAALARALALDPPILFLDEPTAGLDPIAAGDFDQLIVKLKESLGVTVVMVTHDLDTLFTICDRVAVLVDKKVICDTLPNLLKNDHPWIRQYFHGPRARGAEEAAAHAAR